MLLACSLALAAPPPGPRLSAPPPRPRPTIKKAPSAAARLQQLAGVPPPGPRLQAPAPAPRLLSRPGNKLTPARRKQKARNNPIVQVLNSFMSLLSFGARNSSKKTAHPKRLTVAKPKPKHVTQKKHKIMLNSYNKRLKSLKHPKPPPRPPRPPAPPSVVTRPDKGEVKRLVVALHSRLEAVLAQQTAASLPPSPDPGHSSSRFQTVFASDAKAGHQGRRK